MLGRREQAESDVWAMCERLQHLVNTIHTEGEAEDRRSAPPEYRRTTELWVEIAKVAANIGVIATTAAGDTLILR